MRKERYLKFPSSTREREIVHPPFKLAKSSCQKTLVYLRGPANGCCIASGRHTTNDILVKHFGWTQDMIIEAESG